MYQEDEVALQKAQIMVQAATFKLPMTLAVCTGETGDKKCRSEPNSSNNITSLHCGRPGLDPWVGKIPWRKEWQPTPVFLPREFHEQRSSAGYSPWGCKELDTTQQLTLLTHTQETQQP